MRNTAFFVAALFLFGLFAPSPLSQAPTSEKPGLSEKDLEKHVYYFDLVDGNLTGDGVRFLINEIGQSQYVLLGEYHGSRRISEFTRAIIPIFHETGCRTFALETGPISAELLSELSSDWTQTIFNLKTFNSSYYVADKSQIFTPIPFFGNVEDAEFLVETRQRKWNLLGLDQEFSFGGYAQIHGEHLIDQ